ncbi:retrotransposon protein, putative, ty1-copia subclass [Tanacetum coccineum]
MFVIEQPIPPAPAANSEANVLAEWNALYDAYNEELKIYVEKTSGVERFGLIHFSMLAKSYGRVNQLVHMLLRLNGTLWSHWTSWYVLPQIFLYTIGELHAMLIEYEKGLPKKAETPQVMMIKGGKIQKANKKSLKAKGKGKANGKGKDKHGYISKPKNPKPTAKEHPAKDDTCYHCKEVGHWKRNCLVFLAELLKKEQRWHWLVSSVIFTIKNYLLSLINPGCMTCCSRITFVFHITWRFEKSGS